MSSQRESVKPYYKSTTSGQIAPKPYFNMKRGMLIK